MSTGKRPKSGGEVAAPHPMFLRYLAKRQEMRAQSETPPPSEGGPPFTLAEIDESIRLMEARLADGQGTRASAMCRLSLDATKALRGILAGFEAMWEGEGWGEVKKLEAEVARLQSRINGLEHAFDDARDGLIAAGVDPAKVEIYLGPVREDDHGMG